MKIEEQLDLYGLPDTPQMRKAARENGRLGRPSGSQNKRTTEWADFLLSQYPSPLIGLAQVASMPVELLAKQLGCTKLEAQQERRLCQIALKDHLHSKMPVAVDVTNHKIIHLHLPVDDAPPAGADGDVIEITASHVPPIPDGSE